MKAPHLSQTFVGLCVAVLLLSPLHAQQQNAEEAFKAESLKLRTALHYDPTVKSPIDALVRLYRDAEREEELIGLYQAHVAKYPDDPGAKAVLTRLYQTMQRVEVSEFIEQAAQQHPDHAYLQYLLSTELRKKETERGLTTLSRAIDLEKDKFRRTVWLRELLDQATTEQGRQLALAQLEKLLKVEAQTGSSLLSLASLAKHHQFFKLALQSLESALGNTLNPEERIHASILAAECQAELGESAAAGLRLDSVLSKLAPDHPRRAAVMTLRIAVIANDEERSALLNKSKTAYQKSPDKESAVLDYAEVLSADGQNSEAIKVLRAGSQSLPESSEIESRLLAILDTPTLIDQLIAYIGERLEIYPDRSDLRYRLVKVEYQKGMSTAAKQDFALVLASLEKPEQSARILDLARYLREQQRTTDAVEQYQNFITTEPTRLDVVRELCEVHLEQGLEERVKNLLSTISSKGAEPENLLDLCQFLVDESFLQPAASLLKSYIEASRTLPFEPGLLLARVHGEMADQSAATQLLAKLRDQADTISRYKSWLTIALLVNDSFGEIPSFFENEQAQFQFADKLWTTDQIEKFIFLCESAERRQLTARVTEVVKARLATEKIDTSKKVKLHQLLVRALADDPNAVKTVEDQLLILSKEDPEKIDTYSLQLAQIYHRAQRPDLSREALNKLNLESIEDANLLRECYQMLIEYGDPELAASALATVTRLEPSDLFSWERRLSLLAAEGDETGLRSAIRSLKQGIAQQGKTAEWRQDTKKALQWHLLDSYWRSIAKILASNKTNWAAALPLLETVETEAQEQDPAWSLWAKALIYNNLNRDDAKNDTLSQMQAYKEKGGKTITFPDGLSIPTDVAISSFTQSPANGASTPKPILPLLDRPQVSWAFEIDAGAVLLQVKAATSTVIALDSWGQVYGIDSVTGKLAWKKNYGTPDAPTFAHTDHSSPINLEPLSQARLVRQLLVRDDMFFLPKEQSLSAYSAQDGSLKWTTQFNDKQDDVATGPWAIPTIHYTISDNLIVGFDPLHDSLKAFNSSSGKLIWEREWQHDNSKTAQQPVLTSLNTGISADGGRIFAYGHGAYIVDAASGNTVWQLANEQVRVFPLPLRESREHLSDEEVVTLEQLTAKPVWVAQNQGATQSHINYLKNQTSSELSKQSISFLTYPGSLLAPTAEWSKHRLDKGTPTKGHLTDGYLWLPDDRGISMVSLGLPLASQHWPETGILLGTAKQSAWLLEGQTLTHINAAKDTVTRIGCGHLGAGPLSGTAVGNWVFVRGQRGISVFNALSGSRIANSKWSKDLSSYLSGTPSIDTDYLTTWQGNIYVAAPGYPLYCFPPTDSARGGKYFTSFGNNRIVALSD